VSAPTEDAPVGGPPADLVRHRAVGLVLVAALAGLLVVALVGLPRDGAALPAVARYAMKVALPDWHFTEPVNEVVYGTRGFDTFGETFLLLAAVVSVALLARGREYRQGFIGESAEGEEEQDQVEAAGGEEPGPENPAEAMALGAEHAESPEAGQESPPLPLTPDYSAVGAPRPERAQAMSVVIRVAVRLVSPVLAVVGCYLVAWGYSPGGGFPAGAVVLGVILLAYAGFGYRRIARAVDPSLFETLEMAGAGIIILTEFLGLVFKGSFSANWLPLAHEQAIRSGGVLQVFSAGEFIEVGTGLTIAIFALLGMGHDWADHGRQDQGGQES
jgi:multicomponent Na+:H+ antiporter subunit B